MPLTVFLAVMLGAALHASWNAIVKGGTDKLMTMVFVAAGAGAIGAAAIPFLPRPDPASWPFLAASTVAQTFYFLLVATAYRAVDMSLAYPLMRGVAPALVAGVGVIWLGEHLSPGAWAGVALICAGVLATALSALAHGSRGGVSAALLNACVIATYTLIDGAGVRLSGAPIAYSCWLFALNALPLVGWALLARRRALLAYARRNLGLGLVGGFFSAASYGLALWAMTGAPIAVVAALRETSILFGLAIANLLLRERIGPRRIAAAILIALGAVSLRLA